MSLETTANRAVELSQQIASMKLQKDMWLGTALDADGKIIPAPPGLGLSIFGILVNVTEPADAVKILNGIISALKADLATVKSSYIAQETSIRATIDAAQG